MPTCAACCNTRRTAVPIATGGDTVDLAHEGHMVRHDTPTDPRSDVTTARSSRSVPQHSQRAPSGQRLVSSGSRVVSPSFTAHHRSEIATITNRAKPAMATTAVSTSPLVRTPHLKLSTTGLRTQAAKRRPRGLVVGTGGRAVGTAINGFAWRRSPSTASETTGSTTSGSSQGRQSPRGSASGRGWTSFAPTAPLAAAPPGFASCPSS
jgi:hypothetical protein